MKKLYYNIVRYWEFLCIWLSYFKPCKKVFDFDASSMLEIERHQLRRTLASIKKYHYHIDSKHSISWIKTALRILDRILDDSIYAEYDIKEHKYIRKPYVNTKNYKRFSKLSEEDFSRKNQDFLLINLYEKKLWYLYNKIRYNYLYTWWE